MADSKTTDPKADTAADPKELTAGEKSKLQAKYKEQLFSGAGSTLKGIGVALDFQNKRNQLRFKREQLRYSAANAYNQGIQAQYMAEYEEKLAAIRAKEIVRNYKRFLGRMRSSGGASGAVVGDGSSLDAMLDTSGEASMQRQEALYQGELAAWRDKVQAEQAFARAKGNEAEAKASKMSSTQVLLYATKFASSMVSAWSSFSGAADTNSTLNPQS